MTNLKDLAKAAADKFCGWKLPQDFYPDCHISFDREKASTQPHSWPIGTNLLTHAQAQAMFEHCLAEALAQQVEQQPVVLPMHETPEMHDAVMSVLYKDGATRCGTDKLWQAYRRALLAAAPAAQPANAELLRSSKALLAALNAKGYAIPEAEGDALVAAIAAAQAAPPLDHVIAKFRIATLGQPTELVERIVRAIEKLKE